MPIASPAPQSASLPVSVPASAVPDPLKTPTSSVHQAPKLSPTRKVADMRIPLVAPGLRCSSRTKIEAVPKGASYEEAASNPQHLTREAAEAQREERKIERDQKCAELTQCTQTL